MARWRRGQYNNNLSLIEAQMRQIPLPLDNDEISNDLIITSCNQHIYDRISAIDKSERVQLLVLGDDKSAKNLFGRYFEQCCGGVFIKDADKLHDNKTFFAWNKAHEEGRSLMMSAAHEPSRWDILLPDLKSRIASMELLQIGPPDDELIMELIMQKLRLADVAIASKALSYCQKRLRRDYASLDRFIGQCIIIAKEQNRAIKLVDVKPLLMCDGQGDLL